jgi:hypothetical protein
MFAARAMQIAGAAPPAAVSVAYDATGAGNSSLSTTLLTWTHNASGSDRAVLVAIEDVAGAVSSITYGGVSMSLLASQNGNNQSGSTLYVYGLTGPATGSQTVSVICTSASGIVGNSVSFTGVGSFGTAVKAFGTTASLSMSATAATNGMIFQAFGAWDSAVTLSSYNRTQRFVGNVNQAALIGGHATGTGSSLSFTASCNTTGNWWSGIAIPLVAA